MGLFRPERGETFDILIADGIEGMFDEIVSDAIGPTFWWEVEYLFDVDVAGSIRDVVRIEAIPEPGTGLLVMLGLAALSRRSRGAAR